MTSLRADKDMGNFWVWFWLVAFWGAREALGLVRKEGSEQECPRSPQDWNPVNKNPFPLMLIVGSYVKVAYSVTKTLLSPVNCYS